LKYAVNLIIQGEIAFHICWTFRWKKWERKKLDHSKVSFFHSSLWIVFVLFFNLLYILSDHCLIL